MVCRSFSWNADVNGIRTISDVWTSLGLIFHWPGDKLIELVAQQPKLAVFFEISQLSCGNWFSVAVSTVVWFVIFVILVAIGDK